MQPKNADFSPSAADGGREATLAGQVVVITGAASGIGRAVALACGRRGAHLALADLSPELETLRAELEGLGVPPPHVLTRVLDVTVREQVFAWAADVATHLGPATAIVNAAGVTLHCPLDETTSADFEWVMQTNFWGTVHGTQAFLPQLVQQGRGHIVNLSSVFGLLGFPATGAYVASKFAVRGFTETLSLELALTSPGIVVTCVHPGGIKTDLVRRGRTRGLGPLARNHDEVAESFDRTLARTTAEACAEEIALCLLRKRRRLLVGLDAHLIDTVVRLFPSSYQSLLAWLFRRSQRKPANTA